MTTAPIITPSVNAIVSGHIGIDPRAAWPDPSRYKVNMAGVVEAINQPLYSYQAYPAAGSAQLSFFQTPTGQSNTTIQDTNMQLAGQIPAPQMFLVSGIGVDYLPGAATTTLPVFFGAQGANGWANDFYTIFRQGELELIVGNKSYLQMAPLLSMPMRSHLQGSFAAADGGANAVTVQQLRFNTAWSQGEVFKPIPLLLEAGQNFRVNINFPGGAIATVSGDAAARIGVTLYGTMYRPVQ